MVQNLPQLGLALILLFGGWLVIHGKLQVGAILAFSAYVVMMQAPFQMLGMLVMLGQRASASAKRIYEILDEPATIVDAPGAIDLCRLPRARSSSTQVDFAYARRAARAGEPVVASAARRDGCNGRPYREREDHRFASATAFL